MYNHINTHGSFMFTISLSMKNRRASIEAWQTSSVVHLMPYLKLSSIETFEINLVYFGKKRWKEIKGIFED